ncbi:MAG: RNA pyrophosphohydrolase [Pseudomonadota bacterium]|nr:RNA pyrophosphohydrolase [Pseudomonadota bacterium]
MTDADPPPDLSRYRPNVGVVLFNPQGRVWLGRRSRTPGPNNWQFPQGGVDDGEDLEAAARRELQEETGVTSVELLGRTDDWMLYDFPPEVLARPNTRGFAGQRQVWFAFRFTGQDSEVDLKAVPPVEFDSWRWADLAEALDRVVPFKRATYAAVIDRFRRFAEPV